MEVAGLGATVAGVVVAIIAFVVPMLTNSGGASTANGNDPAHLVVDSVRARDFSQGPHPRAHVEILIHNTGGTLAVLHGAEVRVTRVYAVHRCASQDDIPLSETYGVVLPHRSAVVREVPLHDQVSPDGVDRFAISVSTPLSKRSPATYFLFRLNIAVNNDSPEPSLSAGTVMIALPTVPDQGEYYWTPTTVELLRSFNTEGRTVAEFWGESMPCWRRNTKVLRQAFDTLAVRSAKLNAISRELIAPSFTKLE